MSQKLENFNELAKEQADLIIKFFNNRFGVDKKYFLDFTFYQIKDVTWMLHRDTAENLNKLRLCSDKYERVGIRIVRGNLYGPKPTSTILQILSNKISKNRIEISRKDLLSFFNREEFDQNDDDEKMSEGHIAISYEGRVIGCGKLKDGIISSEFPKKLVHNLRLSQL